MTDLHDPTRTLSELRDHLARHDKPLAFLFGAGTSCSVVMVDPTTGTSRPLIPPVAGLTGLCRDAVARLGPEYSAAWQAMGEQCRGRSLDPHIENMLSLLRMMSSAVGSGDRLAGLTSDQISAVENTVLQAIATAVSPDPATIPSELPHRAFASWIASTSRRQPVEIFTCNYDILFERALEGERVPVFDGFVGALEPFFHADSIKDVDGPGAHWTRLWKMHGSVTWRRVPDAVGSRIVRGHPTTSGEMIYPSYQKYDQSRQQPYAAFRERLTHFLEQDDALLVVAGYSFSDDHINDLLFSVLEVKPRTHLYALQFEDLVAAGELCRRAGRRANTVVVGPHSAVIGGQLAAWADVGVPAVLEPYLVREPEGGVSVKVGDFRVLSAFLASMTRSSR